MSKKEGKKLRKLKTSIYFLKTNSNELYRIPHFDIISNDSIQLNQPGVNLKGLNGIKSQRILSIGVIVILLLFIFFKSQILCFADKGKSIESRLSGTVGKERALILSELVGIYQGIKPKKALEYGKEALEILSLNHDQKLEISLLNNMSTASILIGDFHTSAGLANKSYTIAKAVGDLMGEADALHNLGRAYWNQGRYRETRDCLDKAENIYWQMRDQKGLAKAYRLRSDIYWKMGEFSRTQEYIFKTLKIFEGLGDQRGIAEVRNVCGIISAASGEYQEGLSYFTEAKRRYDALDDKGGIANTLNNIGFTYCKMGKPSQALEYFSKSLQISQQLGAKQLTATVLSSLGEAYAQMEQYHQALDYFSQSLKLNQTQNDSMGISYNLIQMGKSQRKLSEYIKAKGLLVQALKIARSINIYNEIKAAAKELSEIHEILGEYQKSLAYYQEYNDTDEKLFKEISSKKMLQIQNLYETDKEEKAISLLKKERQLQQLKLEQQKTFMNSVLAVALLILFLVMVTYTLYRLKSRTTRSLAKEIEEHKYTLQKLRESEEKFRTLAEKSAVGIRIIRDNVILYANSAFLELLGRTLEDVIGQSPLEMVMEEDQAVVMKRLNPSISRENTADIGGFEYRGLSKEGKVIYLESYSVRTFYGGKAAILETIVDITESKKAAMERLKTRKLESMGTMAGIIARDFHHLLTEVTDDVIMLKGYFSDDSPLCRWVENLKKTTLKATKLAQKLAVFSRGGGAEPREVAFSTILKNTFDTYPQMEKWINSVSIPDNLNTIFGDERELTQVMNSLLWNSREAKNSDKEAFVTINAQNIVILPGNEVSLKPGGYIKVAISDSGRGIPEDQLDKVFDPYFSTKDTYSQKGMGLGLAICYSIIKKHSGNISIKSEVGKGTTVELILPTYKKI